MPREKGPTIEDEINAVSRHDSQLCCYWADGMRCQNYGVIVKAHVVKWCKVDEDRIEKKLIGIGYCAEHDFDSVNVMPERQETLREYFDRTYDEALKHDPLVRGATTEEDKSLLLQLLRDKHAKALSRSFSNG